MAALTRDQRLADVLLIASWTGLRWSELREARVRDFVRVPMPVLLISRAAPEGVEAKVTKSGKSRRMPIADRILSLVEACADGKGPDELLFTTKSSHQLHASPVKRTVRWSTVAPDAASTTCGTRQRAFGWAKELTRSPSRPGSGTHRSPPPTSTCTTSDPPRTGPDWTA